MALWVAWLVAWSVAAVCCVLGGVVGDVVGGVVCGVVCGAVCCGWRGVWCDWWRGWWRLWWLEAEAIGHPLSGRRVVVCVHNHHSSLRSKHTVVVEVVVGKLTVWSRWRLWPCSWL